MEFANAVTPRTDEFFLDLISYLLTDLSEREGICLVVAGTNNESKFEQKIVLFFWDPEKRLAVEELRTPIVIALEAELVQYNVLLFGAVHYCSSSVNFYTN